MEIIDFFDQDSNTFTYLVYDERSKDAVVIDPVVHVIEVKTFIESHDLHLKFILETHIHADHISGARVLKETYPNAKICISKKIEEVHYNFKNKLELEVFDIEKTSFDYLLDDQDKLPLGNSHIDIIATPGHTPACISYLIDGNLFTGDSMFMPDFGSGRCDFPGGSAKALYHSIHEKLFKLPFDTKVFVGHDYGKDGREIMNKTTIRDSKLNNHQIGEAISEEEFVKFREERDSKLAEPKNLLKNIKANLFGGLSV